MESFAERNGVDLIKVIKAIKMRPTHSNIIPRPGVGGYCLPRGGVPLGLQTHPRFRTATKCMDIDDTRIHVAQLARDASAISAATSRVPMCCSAEPAIARTWEHAVQRLGNSGRRAHEEMQQAKMHSPRPVCLPTGTNSRARTRTRLRAIVVTVLPEPERASDTRSPAGPVTGARGPSEPSSLPCRTNRT